MKHNRNNEKFSSPTEGVELSLLFKWGDRYLYRYTQKMRVVPGNPFSSCEAVAVHKHCSQAESAPLVCDVCVQGELESAEDLTGERGSEGGVQTQSRRWERRGLCCTHVPHMNSKHRIHHGTCSPWIIYFSISKHLEAVRSTSQACCGCVGILAQNPS